MELDAWRSRIDGINRELLKLLNERAQCALAIGSIKRNQGLAIHDPARERRVLQEIESLNQGPLPAESLQRIFAVIMEEHRRLEETR